MKHRTRMAAGRGFTLIELLLVMVILVVLSSIVVPRITQYREKANLTKVATDLHNLETCLDAFKIDCGRYPTADEGLAALVSNPGLPGWSGPYVKLMPSDPWNNAYVYHIPGEHFPDAFDLYSIGPDKQDGSDDNLGNWQELK